MSRLRKPAHEHVSADQHQLFGGRLCLDFVNTVEPRRGPIRQDYLRDFTDLVLWEQHAGVLSQEEGAVLRYEQHGWPIDAEQIVVRAVALREALYRLFSVVIAGRAPADADVACLNQACGRREVRYSDQGFRWSWSEDADVLGRLLGPIAYSAGELLTSRELSRVKLCSLDDGCGWLFLDTSKNGSRRYCNMAGCGNRARFRRYYARKREQLRSE